MTSLSTYIPTYVKYVFLMLLWIGIPRTRHPGELHVSTLFWKGSQEPPVEEWGSEKGKEANGGCVISQLPQ